MDIMEQFWECEDFPAAAKMLFTTLWRIIGRTAGTLTGMSVQRLAAVCHVSEGKIRDRLRSLERVGQIERVPAGRGEFDLMIHAPLVPVKPTPPKPMPLLDYGERSEIPAEKQREKHSEIPVEIPAEIPAEIPREKSPEIRKPPDTAESVARRTAASMSTRRGFPVSSCRTPQNDKTLQNTGSNGSGFFASVLAKFSGSPPQEQRETPDNRSRPRSREAIARRGSRPKNETHSLYSIESIDINNLNSIESKEPAAAADGRLPASRPAAVAGQNQKFFSFYEEVRAMVKAKNESYMPILIEMLVREHVIPAKEMRSMIDYSKEKGRTPMAALHWQLKNGRAGIGENNLGRYRKRAVNLYMERSRKEYLAASRGGR
ncbi:MAG: hypothetical protein LBQ54_15995 [Planctomycetaceae bacterium]|jgi:hypothetical protein|nr:hypothetical protein [Planctomycetaceae bacterium]